MLKYINLKNLTTCTFVAVLTAASLISQPATANNGNGNSNQTCKSNNGNGNNAPTDVTLKDGTRIYGTYDPSNPGNSANNQLTVTTKQGASISYNSLTQAQKDEFVAMVKDIELRGLSASGINCNTSSASVEKSITVTLEPAKTQASQLPAAGTYVVDFNNRSGTAGFSLTNGTGANMTTYTYGGDLNVKNADQWGGANGSKYITQADGKNSFNIKVNQDQKYFGFWWSAGDAANKITFRNDGQDVTVFETKDLVKFIDSQNAGQKEQYYGNPAYTGKDTGHKKEAFAFVNVFFNNQVYDEIVVQTLVTSGAKFESDNHTFSAKAQDTSGTVVPRLATALADQVSTNEDSPTSGSDNVLSNDIGDDLIVNKVNGVPGNVGKPVILPSGATVTLNQNGTFIYNPNKKFESLDAGQTAADTFSYEIKDNKNNVSTGNVTIIINGAADVPVAIPDVVTTNEDTPTTGNIKANDTDTDTINSKLTISQVNGNPANVGKEINLSSGAKLTVNSNGTFNYNPNRRFEYLNNGETAKDTFTYTVKDPQENSASTTVTINITGVTDPTD